VPSNLSLLGDTTGLPCNELNPPTTVLGTEDLLALEYFLRYIKAISLFSESSSCNKKAHRLHAILRTALQ